MKTMSDIHKSIADSIVERLESVIHNGETLGRWEKPFKGGNAFNVTSGKHYRGINQFLLGFTSQDVWGTFKQWKAKGGCVRKGEKGAKIIFYTQVPCDKNDKDNKAAFPLLRSYSVFHQGQVEGADTIDAPACAFNANADIDAYIGALGIKAVYSSQPAYSPAQDLVRMPKPGDIVKTTTSTQTEAFYATYMHELTHATGHKSRCDRGLGGFFGNPDYAFEELVAELGAVLACSVLGITDTVREDHIKYMRSWLKALKDDPKIIFKAATLAQQALDWMDGQQHQQTDLAA